MTRGLQRALSVNGLSAAGEDAKAVVPFLVPISEDASERQRQLNAFEIWAREAYAVSWLVSPAPVGTLAELLGRRLDVVLSDEQSALLRISDTRILPIVQSLLSDIERAQFFSSVSQWWYFDRQERLQCISCELAQGSDMWRTPWRLTPVQESALLMAAEPDTVLALLHEQVPAKLQTLPRPQRHEFVRDRMSEARAWGLESAEQHALYCLIALSLGADFSERPQWQEALTHVRERTMSLMEALDAIEQGKT